LQISRKIQAQTPHLVHLAKLGVHCVVQKMAAGALNNDSAIQKKATWMARGR
jgi:hypothetical protein